MSTIRSWTEGGMLAAGAQAAVAKYDHQARVPNCLDAEAVGSPAGRCCAPPMRPCRSSSILTGSPAAGWDVTRDDDAHLEARRDGLVFVLAEDRGRTGMVAIAIKQAKPVALPEDL